MGAICRPFFSIIVPVYQCEKTLENCLDSILLQDENDYEIILVDDGSTDKSNEICDSYANKFTGKILTIHKVNEGPLIARITGIESGNGQFFMFLDADDIYMPSALSQVRRAIELNHADMMIFNYFKVFPDGKKQLCRPQYADGKIFEGPGLRQLYEDIISGDNLNSLWEKCISRELLSEIDGFRKYGRMLIGEDKLLSMGVFNNVKKAVYLADGLYEYHIVKNSISHRCSVKHYKDMMIVYHQTLIYMQQWNLSNCKIMCCVNKVNFGLNCLYNIAEKIMLHQTGFAEYKELSENIFNDLDYWNAFDLCKRNIALRKAVICRLLRYHFFHLSAVCFFLYIIVKK